MLAEPIDEWVRRVLRTLLLLRTLFEDIARSAQRGRMGAGNDWKESGAIMGTGHEQRFE